MPSKPVTRYECPTCNQHHADMSDARACCDPDEIEMHECTVCGHTDDNKERADSCCHDNCPACNREFDDTDELPSECGDVCYACQECGWTTGDPVAPTQEELEAAGQLRIF